MRLFFPSLLLVVSLIVFVFSGWTFVSNLQTIYYFGFVPGSLAPSEDFGLTGVALVGTNSVLLNLLLSAWAAAWAWKEFQRVKVGRIE